MQIFCYFRHHADEPMRGRLRLPNFLSKAHRRIATVAEIFCINDTAIVLVHMAAVEHERGKCSIVPTHRFKDIYIERTPKLGRRSLKIMISHALKAVFAC